MINISDLRKDYRVFKYKEGLVGAFLNLFSTAHKVVHAVKGINCQVKKGEMVGFIGPNGAGKSTTIKILSGILMPTSGEVTVNGYVPHRDRTKYVKNIGVVFGQRVNLWWDLPVIESFKLYKSLYQIPEDRYKANLDRFKEILQLDDFLGQPVRQLSLGQRMRAELAGALLHDPDILFLDEPTIGLDVVAKENIRSFIREINQERGVTVLLTTHDLGDVEKLCKRIVIIDHGTIVYDGLLEKLKQKYQFRRTLQIDFVEPPQFNPKELFSNVTEDVVSDLQRRYHFSPSDIRVHQLIREISDRSKIMDLSLLETETEEIIRQIYLQDTV